MAEGIKEAVNEVVTQQIEHLFAKLLKAESMGNWPNVIDVGERILKVLPDHAPTCGKTSAAYVKKWASKIRSARSDKEARSQSNDVYADRSEEIFGTWNKGLEKLFDSGNPQGWKNRETLKEDLIRANELDPNNAEFYYWRSAMEWNFVERRYSEDEAEDDRLTKEWSRRVDQQKLADLTQAIQLDPQNGKYYYRRSRCLAGEAARKDFNRAVELGDRNALEDNKAALEANKAERERLERNAFLKDIFPYFGEK